MIIDSKLFLSTGLLIAKRWIFKNSVPDRVGGGTVRFVSIIFIASTSTISDFRLVKIFDLCLYVPVHNKTKQHTFELTKDSGKYHNHTLETYP